MAIGITVAVFASIAILTYFFQSAPTSAVSTQNPRPTVRIVQVAIPQDAYLAPDGWSGGYVFNDRYFTPNGVIISAGDTVEWINKDSLAHAVTSHKTPVGTKMIDSGPLDTRRSWRFVFKTAGEYEYHCNFHPWGAGKVVVQG